MTTDYVFSYHPVLAFRHGVYKPQSLKAEKNVIFSAIILSMVMMSVISVPIQIFVNKRDRKKAMEVLEELDRFRIDNPVEALELLRDTPAIPSKKRKQVASHYIHVILDDLLIKSPTSLKEALAAPTTFKSVTKETEKWRQTFKLSRKDVYPFRMEEIRKRHLKQQILLLASSLEHYPGRPWLETSADMIFMAMLEYSGGSVGQNEFKLWQGWLWAAYLRQAEHELQQLRRKRYYTGEESNRAVEKILTLLSLTHATPEDVKTSHEELKELRASCQRGY